MIFHFILFCARGRIGLLTPGGTGWAWGLRGPPLPKLCDECCGERGKKHSGQFQTIQQSWVSLPYPRSPPNRPQAELEGKSSMFLPDIIYGAPTPISGAFPRKKRMAVLVLLLQLGHGGRAAAPLIQDEGGGAQDWAGKVRICPPLC